MVGWMLLGSLALDTHADETNKCFPNRLNTGNVNSLMQCHGGQKRLLINYFFIIFLFERHKVIETCCVGCIRRLSTEFAMEDSSVLCCLIGKPAV